VVPPWEVRQNEDGYIYYLNQVTHESTWHAPPELLHLATPAAYAPEAAAYPAEAYGWPAAAYAQPAAYGAEHTAAAAAAAYTAEQAAAYQAYTAAQYAYSAAQYVLLNPNVHLNPIVSTVSPFKSDGTSL